MKTPTQKRNDCLRAEYDFASMKGGIRSKYSASARESAKVFVFPKVIFGIIAAALVAGVGSAWFYIYSGDLARLKSIAAFAPNETATLHDECSSDSVRAVPFNALGKSLVNAVRAVEGDNEQTLAFQISRGLFCHPGKTIQRHLMEHKASAQLRRKFTQTQLLTIYLNRAYFGDALIGVENASQYFYQKHTTDLNLAEAAMIAGLIKAPQMYSPTLHPDRAKSRRDAVIAAMLKRGTITERDAEVAVQSLVLDQTANVN